MMLRAIGNMLVMFAAVFVASATATIATAQSTGEAQLQALVNDTAYQLDLSYRFNVTELERRREEVGKAIAAWNKSSRGEADNLQLAEWLRSAIRSSMPGSQVALAPVPVFEKRVVAEALPAPVKTDKVTVSNAAVTPDLQPATASARSNATEHTLMRPTSTTAEMDSTDSAEAITREIETPSGENFWEDHPASDELPADLSSGDPFLDDPLPTDDDLFFE